MKEVAILGIGRTPWGRFPERYFIDLGVEACNEAFKNAGIDWKNIQAIVASEALHQGKSGLYQAQYIQQFIGDQGICVVNVSNACAVGATTLMIAYMMVTSGRYDIVLAAGADKSPEGFFPALVGDDPKDPDSLRWSAIGATNPAHWALQCQRRMQEYGTTEVQLAKVKVKNSKCGAHNHYARYKKVFTLDEVLNSPMVCSPLRLYEICAVSDGAAAIVLSSAEVARKYTTKPIILASSTVASPLYGDPTPPIQSSIACKVRTSTPIISECIQSSREAYKLAGIGPEDLDVVELPDNSSWHELVYPEALGLCKLGEAERFLEEGKTEIGGKIPINTSGGFASFGECVPAQGLWQVCELVTQLRGQAGTRQVENAKVGLGQVYGAHGSAGTTIIKS